MCYNIIRNKEMEQIPKEDKQNENISIKKNRRKKNIYTQKN